jgi:hypothetical protein
MQSLRNLLLESVRCSLTDSLGVVIIFSKLRLKQGRLCGLVVRVLGYRFGGPGSIPGTTRFSEKKKKKKKGKKVVGLERGPLSLVSTTEELLNK